jgi:hypothetical protein
MLLRACCFLVVEKEIFYADQIPIAPPQLDVWLLMTLEIWKKPTEIQTCFQSWVVMEEVRLIHQCFPYSVDLEVSRLLFPDTSV